MTTPAEYEDRIGTRHRHATESAVMPESEARVITDQIKVGVEAVWELIKRAYTQRAWAALGYSSWDDYCATEFGTARLRLPREERAEVVSSLRESGLSLRAIASATALGRGTVQRELAGVPNGTPEPADPFDYPDSASPGAPVIGMDGKKYQRKPVPQPASKPWRKPPSYRDEFSRALYDLEKLVERFALLVADDRYAVHRAALNRMWFLDLQGLLHDVITDLGPAS